MVVALQTLVLLVFIQQQIGGETDTCKLLIRVQSIYHFLELEPYNHSRRFAEFWCLLESFEKTYVYYLNPVLGLGRLFVSNTVIYKYNNQKPRLFLTFVDLCRGTISGQPLFGMGLTITSPASSIRAAWKYKILLYIRKLINILNWPKS